MKFFLKKILDKQFVIFLLVGGLNTVFGYSIFALFIYIGLHYSVAVLLSTILGVIFNFHTIGRFVFGSDETSRIFKFFLVYGVVYGLNVFGIFVFYQFGVSEYIAGAVLILPVAMVAFLLNKKFVFIPSSTRVGE